jgi:hypothetical protein
MLRDRRDQELKALKATEEARVYPEDVGAREQFAVQEDTERCKP